MPGPYVEIWTRGIMGAPRPKHLRMFRRRASRGQYFHHPTWALGSSLPTFAWRGGGGRNFPPVPPKLEGAGILGYDAATTLLLRREPKGYHRRVEPGPQALGRAPLSSRAQVEDGVTSGASPLTRSRRCPHDFRQALNSASYGRLEDDARVRAPARFGRSIQKITFKVVLASMIH